MDEGQLNRELASVFFIESAEMLSEASVALLKAEEAGNPNEVIHQVFRAIHSIKGGAQSLDFEQLSEVAHRMEDFLVPLQRGNCVVDEQTVSLLLEAMDVIEMQIYADQTGEPPVDCGGFLAKLAEVKAPAEATGATPQEHSVSSQPREIVATGSRLLYLSFTVDRSAPMPGVASLILLEQLRQSGRILYSQPDVDHLGMVVAGEYFKQVAIIQTDMCNADVKEAAYGVNDICDIKVAEIDNGIFSNADKPAKGEIAIFNSLVGNLREILCYKNSDSVYMNKTIKQIVDWGGDSRGAASWFPGGLPAWQRMTSLLSDMVVLTDGSQFHCGTKSIADRTLQVLWETVYNALCNHTYFYSLPVGDILAGNGMNLIEQFEVSGVDVQVVNIDLSQLMTLEGEHLRMLADFRDQLASKKWALWLISEGQYTRRHLNVLEVSEEFVGTLNFYPSTYSAVIASK